MSHEAGGVRRGTAISSPSTLRVTEIFCSLQGESRSAGFPTAFVRLTGCPLRCGYCDTRYAFGGGEPMTPGEIVTQVAAMGVERVTVTGGEPLAQEQSLGLLSRLCDAGFAEVSLETSGALDLSEVDPRVIKVMDLKTPGSGEVDRNLYRNITLLGSRDQVKFVICDRQDYDWARKMLERQQLRGRCEILFSPAAGQLSPTRLAEWIVEDRLPVRFQIQLHKLLWGEERGR